MARRPSKDSRRIGIWAGSSPDKPAHIQRGLKKLHSFGLEAFLAPETVRYASKPESKARPFLAGPDEAKVRAFETLWKRDDIFDILCVRGGYGCLRLLPLLDRRKLPKRRKRFWGFSDLTVIQFYLFNRFGLPWVHSPMLSGRSLGLPTPREVRAWQATFASEGPTTEDKKLKLLAGPRYRGPKTPLFLGGNLACLVSLLGTPWEPRARTPYLLFIEDIAEPAYKTDRLLQQLAASRFFANCAGVVVGHFTDSPGADDVLKAWAKETKIPLYGRLEAGHEAPNIPLPMGVRVNFDVQNSGVARLRLPIPRLGGKLKRS